MTLFHRHTWIETSRVRLPALSMRDCEVNAPVSLFHKILSMSVERTAVHLRCTGCGDVRSRVLDGWTGGEESAK